MSTLTITNTTPVVHTEPVVIATHPAIFASITFIKAGFTKRSVFTALLITAMASFVCSALDLTDLLPLLAVYALSAGTFVLGAQVSERVAANKPIVPADY